MNDANGLPTLDFGPIDESFFVKPQYAAASDAVAVLYMVGKAIQTTQQTAAYEMCVGFAVPGARDIREHYATRQEAIDAANAHYRANRRTP